MRPFLLRGHTRPITQVVYNREGDLILTSGTDRVVNIWYSDNGERLGSLGADFGEGHKRIDGQHRSVIWTVDINRQSTQAVTGSGDMSCKVWDVENGKPIVSYDSDSMNKGQKFGSSIRSVQWSLDGRYFIATQDRQMTEFAKVFVVDSRADPADSVIKSWRITNDMVMDTKTKWGWMDESVLTGNDKGVLQKWDWRHMKYERSNDTNELGIPSAQVKAHMKNIKDLVLNDDRTMCMTSSKDHKVKIWDYLENDFHQVREIEHPSNANSCCFNPFKNHIAVGGGEDAKSVTQSGAQGHFETYLYNYITNEQIGTFKGHFSPINSLAWHPNGKQICTGGEEGNARVNNLDKSYLEFKEHELDLVMEDPNYIPIDTIAV